MENQARSQQRLVSKHYDKMVHNDWTLNFEYEVEGERVPKIIVNGQKGKDTVYAAVTKANTQVMFSSNDYDNELAGVIMDEVAAIKLAAAPEGE